MNSFDEAIERWEEERRLAFQVEQQKIREARKVVRRTLKFAAWVFSFLGMLALYTWLEVR